MFGLSFIHLTLLLKSVVPLSVGGIADNQFVQLTPLVCDASTVCATSQPSKSLSVRGKTQCMFECRHLRRTSPTSDCVGVNYHESDNTCDIFSPNPFGFTKNVVGCQYYQVTNTSNVQCNQILAADPCSPSRRPAQIVASSGIISTPNYPSNYYNNAVCQWLIISPASNGIVTLSFTDLQTENDWDFFAIYDGSNSSYPQIAELSGGTPPSGTKYSTTQRYMFVYFVSDNGYANRGFSAKFEVIP